MNPTHAEQLPARERFAEDMGFADADRIALAGLRRVCAARRLRRYEESSSSYGSIVSNRSQPAAVTMPVPRETGDSSALDQNPVDAQHASLDAHTQLLARIDDALAEPTLGPEESWAHSGTRSSSNMAAVDPDENFRL